MQLHNDFCSKKPSDYKLFPDSYIQTAALKGTFFYLERILKKNIIGKSHDGYPVKPISRFKSCKAPLSMCKDVWTTRVKKY